jgi:hypothetical protein
VARTTATIALFAVALWVLSILTRPFNAWRIAMVASMGVMFVGVMAIPPLRDYFALVVPPLVMTLATIGIAAIACGILEIAWRAAGWVDRKPGLPDLGITIDDDEADVSDERFPLFDLLDDINPKAVLAKLRSNNDEADADAHVSQRPGPDEAAADTSTTPDNQAV